MQNTYQTEEIEEHCRSTNQLKRANGVRYPLVGGTRQCHFDGTHSKPHKLPENAATPTRRVHAVLGAYSKNLLLPPNLADMKIGLEIK